MIALRWSDNERVDVDNVVIKTYEDDPEIMAKIPKLAKTFRKEWDRIQRKRTMTSKRGRKPRNKD